MKKKTFLLPEEELTFRLLTSNLNMRYKDNDSENFTIRALDLIQSNPEIQTKLLSHIKTHYPFEFQRISKLISIY